MLIRASSDEPRHRLSLGGVASSRTSCSYHTISACISNRVLSIGNNSNGEWFIFYSAWVVTCSSCAVRVYTRNCWLMSLIMLSNASEVMLP